MKLWQRISLSCALVLALIVAACSALLLAQSKTALMAAETARAQQKQHDLQASFSAMANHYLTEDMGRVARASLVQYCFSRFADGAGVLVQGGDTLFSRTDTRPESLLPLIDSDGRPAYGQQTIEAQADGRRLVIVGGNVRIGGDVYRVYVAEDVSPVSGTVRAMAGRFALVAACGMLAGAAILLPLARRITRPLAALSAVAGRIADGEYHERAAVHTRDEIGMLAGNFNRMAHAVETRMDALTETARRQQLFIAGVTHEYKTPLTSMLIHADTLQNTRLRAADRTRAIAYIRDQCEYLEHLTQRLLQLLLIGEITLSACDVPALLESVRAGTAELCSARHTPLVIECSMERALLDPSLMRSLLTNLVDNAAKASQPGQAIRLAAQDGCFTVSDRGSGIPEADLPRVTEPFYMADRSRSKRQGGSGLGLALVRRIADAHGASLAIESAPGAGTTVTVRLPAPGGA